MPGPRVLVALQFFAIKGHGLTGARASDRKLRSIKTGRSEDPMIPQE